MTCVLWSAYIIWREEALYDSTSLRRFAGIDLGSEPLPCATTILRFCRLLQQHKLAEACLPKWAGCYRGAA